MKRKDVVKLRRQQRQRKWHEKAGEQEQPTKDLHREEEGGEVRCAGGNKELDCQGIRQGRLVDEVEKSIQPNDSKYQPQQIASNDGSQLHALAPWRRRACVCTASRCGARNAYRSCPWFSAIVPPAVRKVASVKPRKPNTDRRYGSTK